MFKTVSKFTLLVFAVMVFVGVGLISLYYEVDEFVRRPLYSEELPMGTVSTDKSMNEIEGNQLLGMILLALRGEYIIIVDGVLINSSTDPETLILSGVAGNNYNISSVMDPHTAEITIVANIK